MENRDIHKLLEKYFEGETTFREEYELRDYFHREDIDPDLLPYQPLFRFQNAQRKEKLDADFTDRLEKKLKPVPTRPMPVVILRRSYSAVARVAAAVLIAATAWWLWPEPAVQQETAAIDWSKYEPKDPEEALKLTHKALAKLSGELRRGAATAAKEVDNVEKIGRFFNK